MRPNPWISNIRRSISVLFKQPYREKLDFLLACDAIVKGLIRCWFPLSVGIASALLITGLAQGREAMIATGENLSSFVALGLWIGVIFSTQLTSFSSLLLHSAEGSERQFAAHFVSGLVGLTTSLALALLIEFRAPDSSLMFQEMRPRFSMLVLLTTCVVVIVRNQELKFFKADSARANSDAVLGLIFVCFVMTASFLFVSNIVATVILSLGCLLGGDLLGWRASVGLGPARTMRILSWTMSSLSIIAGLPLIFWPFEICRSLGPVLTVYLLVNFWVGVGLIVLLIARRLPSRWAHYLGFALVAVILIAFARGPFGYSEMRLQKSETLQLRTLEEQARAWLMARKSAIESKSPYPVFFVAAEGGGARAAFWTAANLAVLEDRSRSQSKGTVAFSEHTFAISTVSGSSLGAAVYLSLLRDNQANYYSPLFREGAPRRFEDKSVAMLGSDFLSPALASLIVGDVLRSVFNREFLPNRCRIIEEAFERTWAGQMGQRSEKAWRFDRQFSRLWENDKAEEFPALVLNGTNAANGSRLVYGSFAFGSTDTDAIDLRRILENQDLSLSSAIMISARFPVISPVGIFSEAEEKARGIVVTDGGFADVSGAATLAEIVEVFIREAKKLELLSRLRLQVLMISNEPTVSSEKSAMSYDAINILDRVRIENGRRYKRVLKAFVESNKGEYLDGFRLKRERSDPEFALGWMLSKESWSQMQTRIHRELLSSTSSYRKVVANLGEYGESTPLILRPAERPSMAPNEE